jgi:hypothetical protein
MNDNQPEPTTSSESHVSPSRVLQKAFSNRSFVLCLVLLVVFSAGFQIMILQQGIRLQKEALQPKTALAKMSQRALAPYELEQPVPIEPSVLNQLGTDEYINWVIRDPTSESARGDHPLLSYFVTYYTGSPDQVPHIPDECYAGSGHKVNSQKLDSVEITVDGQEQVVPVQVLDFRRIGEFSKSQRLVIYTFHANGQWRSGRRAVQAALADPRSIHAYFSKIEVAMSIGDDYASQEEAAAAGKRFLQKALPVLLKDHLPDFEKAEQQAEQAAGDSEDAAAES